MKKRFWPRSLLKPVRAASGFRGPERREMSRAASALMAPVPARPVFAAQLLTPLLSAVLLLAALLFLGTGCSASSPQSGQAPPAQSGGDLSASAADPASQGADALPAFSGTMTMALRGDGFSGGMIAGTGDGAYTLLPSTEDFSARILYYDYATRQLIYLSNQVLVTNDEENPGWIEDVFGGAVLLTANDRLYVVKYGKSPLPSIGYEGSPTCLLQMEPNAANRKTLTVPPDSLLSYSTGIAADGENLYLIFFDYDAAAMQISGRSLRRTCFGEDRLETLFAFDAGWDGIIAGVYPEGLVLRRSQVPAEYADARLADQMPYMQYAFQLYSLRENRLSDTDFSWKQGELSLAMDDTGTVYFVKSGETRLYARDLQTGKEWVVAENLIGEDPGHPNNQENPEDQEDRENQEDAKNQENQENPENPQDPETTKNPEDPNDLPDAGRNIWLTGEIYNGHILFTVSDEAHTRYYAYEPETQKTLPLTLSFEHEGGEMFVSIKAESDEYFLVFTGFVTTQHAATGTDGTFYTVDAESFEYMLIQKEDYWNSVPNYLPFDDSLL